MSIQAAINFISRVDSDSDFRKSCYRSTSLTDLLTYTAAEGMKFTVDEIEDAFNVLELKCQTYEQAGRVKEIQAWYRLFQ